MERFAIFVNKERKGILKMPRIKKYPEKYSSNRDIFIQNERI